MSAQACNVTEDFLVGNPAEFAKPVISSSSLRLRMWC
jgi:hypothetical protein